MMLSSFYVFGKYKEKSPCEMYGIDKQTWESFVQSQPIPLGRYISLFALQILNICNEVNHLYTLLFQ